MYIMNNNVQNWICITTTHWMKITSIITEKKGKFSLCYAHKGWVVFN